MLLVPTSVDANFIYPDSRPIEKKTFSMAIYEYRIATIPNSAGRNIFV
ncbi:MAG: hypothetical protein R3A12_16460 [Ignavibacteria bacterium]